MINKSQYIRLTIVLLAPLLILGWWLAHKEIILPHHHVIQCEEFDSHISCFSFPTTKNGQTRHNSDSVRLWQASLVSGFNHPIITLGHTYATYVPGKGLKSLPPVGGGILKTVRLPPASFCRISPISGTKDEWGYQCAGPEIAPESFKFADEETNIKFKNAINQIENEMEENEGIQIRAYIASVLMPLIFYFLVSMVVFFAIKLVRYVINGRQPSPE